MLAVRILVVLFGLPDADTALATVLGGLATASSPFGVRFAVPERFAPEFADTGEGERVLGRGDVLFFHEEAGLPPIVQMLTDETHFLVLEGAHAFAEKWDATLLSRLRKAPEKNALLSGMISDASEETPPQPYLPALAENFEEEGVLIQRGLPLVASAAPVRTLVINPSLFFGPTDFLRRAELSPQTLSIAAYVAGFPVYALDRAPLWPLGPAPQRRLRRPVENALPGTALARFEQLAGFRYEMKRAGVRTTWGLFGSQNTYAQQLPHSVKTAQRAKSLFAHSARKKMLLTVTAFVDLPNPRKPIPVYMLRFGFLQALKNMPVFLYTGGSQERYLRAAFPNTWSYPDSGVLPRSLLQQGMTAEQHMGRGKLLLLGRAAERHPEFTHVAWANIDLLHHPICPDAVPDFSALADDRVHLATVNAVPDASFVVAPVARLRLLCREALAITQMDAELKRGFAETALWERLIDKYPDVFALHAMPRRHLLLLTAFAPELLSERYRALLHNLPPPWRGETQPEPKENKRWTTQAKGN